MRTLILIKGLVSKDKFAIGTKSEHEAVFLTTEDGKKYRLTRIGGHPFGDQQTFELVGKTVELEGFDLSTTFRYDGDKVKILIPDVSL